MSHKIAEIKGLEPEAQSKLASLGIETVEQLLAQTRTPEMRYAMAKRLDVPESQLTDWINRADLMRLKGVGREMANLLEECGVDSCKELRHRVPAHLHDKLKATNDALHITHHAPTLEQVAAWIEEAKVFAGG